MVALLQPPPSFFDLTDTNFAGIVPGQVAIWNGVWWLPGAPAPALHGWTHQFGGVDQINVGGLPGVTAALAVHLLDFTNPHAVTWAQVGAIPNVIGAIQDWHINWGVGAGQVSADDIPDGAVNAIMTLVQEAAWAAHLINLLNPHAVTLAQLGVTATAAEVNLLDLSVPPVALGDVLQGTGPATAAWAPAPWLLTYARGKSAVVAASNAMDLVNADYFCTGANDEVQINLAIVAVAAAGGGVVYLSDGLFVINASVTMFDNVMLQGAGHGTIIQIAAGVVVPQAIGEAAVAGHIGLKDFAIDGNQAAGSQGEGVYFTNAPYTFITGLYIHDTESAGMAAFGGSGIYLDNCDYSIIMNNWIHDCGTGIVVMFGIDAGIQILNSTACIIANNTMTDCTLPGALFDNVTYSSIAGNVALNSLGHGFQLENTTVSSITRNVASGNAIYGIEVGAGCEYNLLALNVCDQNTQVGMYIMGTGHSVISTNVLTRNGNYGLGVASDHNAVTSNSAVENNQVGAVNIDEILISGDYNLVASNMARYDNAVAPNLTRYGLHIAAGGIGNVVEGNDLYLGGATADYFDAGTNTLERDNRVTEGWYSLPIMLEHQTGRYYAGVNQGALTTNIAVAANQLYALPFVVPHVLQYDRIGVNIAVIAAGNATLGIYYDAGGYPGALLLDAGIINTGLIGIQQLVIAQTLGAGWYWIVYMGNAAPTLTGMNLYQGFATTLATAQMGVTALNDGNNYAILRAAQAYGAGALPPAFPAGAPFAANIVPRIMMRAT